MGRLHTVLAGALVVVQEEQEVVGALVVVQVELEVVGCKRAGNGRS